MGRKKILIIFLLLVIVGGAAALISFHTLSENKKNVTYLEGMDAYQAGDYSAARKAFESVKGYQNAAEMLKEIDYQEALIAIQEGNDEAAEKVLLTMPDYKEAQSNLYLITYHKVKACMESGDYDQAEAYANQISGYEDIAALKQEITYQKALVQINAAQFDQAKALLAQVSDGAKVENAIAMINYSQYAVPAVQDLYARHPGGTAVTDLLEARLCQVSYNTGATIPLIMLHYSVATETGETAQLYAAYDNLSYFGACHTIDTAALDMSSQSEVSAFLKIQPNWASQNTLPLSAPAMKLLAGIQ